MNDELVSALIPDFGLRAVVVSTAGVAREGRRLHKALHTSASLFAQGLTGAAILASLQKEKTRVNLQLECDGPLRGFFCDAGTDGNVRGYVKNPILALEGDAGPFHWRPALGNSGFLSVLRDQGGGEFYRSSVELEAFDLPRDLERYFLISEQVDSVLQMVTVSTPEEPLQLMAGLLLQTLPEGDRHALRTLGDRLGEGGAFRTAVEQGPKSATLLLTSLLKDMGELEWMSRYPLAFKCTCSRERVYRALLAMGRAELEDVLVKDKRAEATCEFCTTQYVVEEEEIKTLLKGSTPGN